MGYYNSTKLIIYFDPNNHHTKQKFNYNIVEYDIKIHMEEYMSLGDLMIQEYPPGVYQTSTIHPEPIIRIIHP